jgi:hypothetical protein
MLARGPATASSATPPSGEAVAVRFLRHLAAVAVVAVAVLIGLALQLGGLLKAANLVVLRNTALIEVAVIGTEVVVDESLRKRRMARRSTQPARVRPRPDAAGKAVIGHRLNLSGTKRPPWPAVEPACRGKLPGWPR